jgi:hypothetical protein
LVVALYTAPPKGQDRILEFDVDPLDPQRDDSDDQSAEASNDLDLTCQTNSLAISADGQVLYLATNFSNWIVAFNTETREAIWYVQLPLRDPIPDPSEPLEHAQTLALVGNELWVAGCNILSRRLCIEDGTSKGNLTQIDAMIFNIEYHNEIAFGGEPTKFLSLKLTLTGMAAEPTTKESAHDEGRDGRRGPAQAKASVTSKQVFLFDLHRSLSLLTSIGVSQPQPSSSITEC